MQASTAPKARKPQSLRTRAYAVRSSKGMGKLELSAAGVQVQGSRFRMETGHREAGEDYFPQRFASVGPYRSYGEARTRPKWTALVHGALYGCRRLRRPIRPYKPIGAVSEGKGATTRSVRTISLGDSHR